MIYLFNVFYSLLSFYSLVVHIPNLKKKNLIEYYDVSRSRHSTLNYLSKTNFRKRRFINPEHICIERTHDPLMLLNTVEEEPRKISFIMQAIGRNDKTINAFHTMIYFDSLFQSNVIYDLKMVESYSKLSPVNKSTFFDVIFFWYTFNVGLFSLFYNFTTSTRMCNMYIKCLK